MQVGGCWFDRERGLLVEQARDESWHLPRAELQVLSLLVEHQGKLVSKHELKTGDGSHPPLTDTSLARAVFMIRSFLGPQYEGLIETVKGQGYLLHSTQGQRFKSLRYPRLQSLPWWSVLLVFGFMLAVSGFYLSRIDHSVPTQPLLSTDLPLASGQHIRLHLYANSKTNNTLLFELGDRLGQGLSRCGHSDWSEVYSSLSHDKQVLNITMRGYKLGQSVIRNLKISDFRRPKEFIDANWLLEVGICG
ncbi:winged helix-turn-helix domain-containing protein [Shewanella seohaensis]|uniref:winged helix-turn-helix domain-containing protein n=1 Tax=Shewanella seohaensis TaxID=755175 RepID=UPI0035B9E805